MMTNPTTDIAWYSSPAGWIRISANPAGITGVSFCEPVGETDQPAGLAAECANQLAEYFAGRLKVFTLPLAPSGSDFQLKVWQELIKIPYGQVITYRDLAMRLGGPTYTRIVGQANGKNPIAMVIPCHRVIGMNGALTGYAGGLWRKTLLLELEQKGNHPHYHSTLF